jgi:predicted nucleic acid-binding Zn ribbon protein
MPTYSMACPECGHTEDRRLAFSEYDGVKAGSLSLPCPECQADLAVGFSPGDVTFVLKDGPSGGWASKALKENKHRAIRHKVMGQRQKDHVFTPSLQPNYKGEETGSWREAQEQARRDLGEAAASTYNPLIPGDK